MNRDAFENGLKTRRAVLGAEYVDASIASADDFNMPMKSQYDSQPPIEIIRQ